MSAALMPPGTSLADILQRGDGVLTDTPVTPDEADLCARLIARYARTPDDGDMLAGALGIDCLAGDWLLAARINRLADSIGATS